LVVTCDSVPLRPLTLSTIVEPDVSFMCQKLTGVAAEAAEGTARRAARAARIAMLRRIG
jgi:hypothetical protein